MTTDSTTPDDRIVTLADLIWISDELQSNEHFVAEIVGGRPGFIGTTVLPIDGQPAHINYEVAIEADWSTRSASVTIWRGSATQHLDIDTDGTGRWTVNGEPVPDLTGCVDIDLGWTPATNTLQIRRLGLDVGEETSLDVAWLQFPELTLERTVQTYRRLTPTSWRFGSGSFEAVLDVDDEGFVVRYGDDLWRRL